MGQWVLPTVLALILDLLGSATVQGATIGKTCGVAESIAPQPLTTGPILVSLSEAALQNGAVCLDGTPAVYHYYPGTGDGANNWVVFLQGGGWCYDLTSCAERASTFLGSTAKEEDDFREKRWFQGIMSQNSTTNPDFYDWNLVFVRYCDGGSFSGDVHSPVEVDSSSEGVKKIYFRGQRIWNALMRDLTENRGMNRASKALLAGTSAGGLATMIQCDKFRSTLRNCTFVKCLSDAGYFLDRKNVEGKFYLRDKFSATLALQNMTANLHPECTSGKKSFPCFAETLSRVHVWKFLPDGATLSSWMFRGPLYQCFFPQYFIKYVETPIYIQNSHYDSWQLSNTSLIPKKYYEDKNSSWHLCYNSAHFCYPSCSKDQLSFLLDFRTAMVSNLRTEKSSGAFITSRRTHGMIRADWNGKIKVNNMTPAEAFGDWYFERSVVNRIQIDGLHPSSSSCLA